MKLKTYVLTPAYTPIIKMIVSSRHRKSEQCHLHPGDLVRHYDGTGCGLTVAVVKGTVTVLWSNLPESERFQVKPIPVPTNPVFFVDYNYGTGDVSGNSELDALSVVT